MISLSDTQGSQPIWQIWKNTLTKQNSLSNGLEGQLPTATPAINWIPKIRNTRGRTPGLSRTDKEEDITLTSLPEEFTSSADSQAISGTAALILHSPIMPGETK